MSDHPDWCAGGHRCGLGEHRSDPLRWGMVVATRIRRADGQGYLELRALVPLPADEDHARDVAGLAAWAVDAILRVVRAGRLAPLREAYRRLSDRRVP